MRLADLGRLLLAVSFLTGCTSKPTSRDAVTMDSRSADKLARSFQNPPDSAKPWTWWHWVSGNVSREGITKDLEAMNRIGLGGAQLFSVDQVPDPKDRGQILYMSPEWRELTRFAVSEADRLGLELAIVGCEGWSESGGPWITPDLSMQKVVWSDHRVTGPTRFEAVLPQPETALGFYRDIAVFAFPTLSGDKIDLRARKPRATAHDGKDLGGDIFDGSDKTAWEPATQPAGEKPKPAYVTIEFPDPVKVASFTVGPVRPDIRGEIQASTDGQNFRTLGTFTTRIRSTPRQTIVFDEVEARWFRINFPNPDPKRPIKVTDVEFAAARLTDWRAKTGVESRPVAFPKRFPNPAAGNVVEPAKQIDLTAQLSPDGRLEWDVPPGDWSIVRFGHTSTNRSNHPTMEQTRGLECDKLSRDAVQVHFDNLLAKVIADAGPLAGKSLKWVLLDSWEAGPQNWTPEMVADFKRLRSYDPTPWLVALTGRIVDSPEKTERFLFDFRRTISDLTADNHYGFLSELLAKHDMLLTAEAVGIGMPTIADQLQAKGRTAMPMGEFWIGRKDDSGDTREAASGAHTYGLKYASAEAFTATPQFAGWRYDPYSLKAQGDEQFTHGINRFVFHRYAHQPDDRKPGMTMGPWGTNFERTQTWWEPGRAYISYLSRCQYLLQQGHFVADLVYYYGENTPRDLRPAELKPQPPKGYDYDACNSEVLLTRMSVADDGRIILPDGMSYRVLVLPDTDRMSPAVLKKLGQLIEAGATVVGPRPIKSPSLADADNADGEVKRLADRIWGNVDGKGVTENAFGKGRVVYGRDVTDILSVVGADFTSSAEHVRYIHRRTRDADIYFLANARDRSEDVECTFRVADKAPEFWYPDTGDIEPAPAYVRRDGRTTVPVRFGPTGSVFVVFRKPGARGADPITEVTRDGRRVFPLEPLPPDVSPAPVPPIDLAADRNGGAQLLAWEPGDYQIHRASGRLDRVPVKPVPPATEIPGAWQLRFPPKWGAPEQVALDKLISWTEHPDDGVRHFSGTAIYVKEFDLPADRLESGQRLHLDLGRVRNLAEVKLNGKNLGVLWKPPFRVDVTSAAKPRRNKLEVKVTNLWPNRLIGDQKLPESERFTWTAYRTAYAKDSPLLESGLIGPVSILNAREVRLP